MVQSTPIVADGHVYDPETVKLLGVVLDEAWAALTDLQRMQLSRSDIAERLLKAAADGERDRVALRARALQGLSLQEPLPPPVDLTNPEVSGQRR